MKFTEQLEESGLKRLAERQAEELKLRRKELAKAQARIHELEHALREACDFADVCKHFPGSDALHPEDES